MQLVDKKLNGLMVFANKQYADNRGYFEEYFNEAKCQEAGLYLKFVQINHSRSNTGVVRGLHYQVAPKQSKLVGVTRGRVWDVAVDLRVDSPTRGQHFAVELSGENGLLFWIPAGFAHGFCVLGNEPADMLYLVDEFYNPKTEGGLVWDDPDLKIPWPLTSKPVISDRDRGQTPWKQFIAHTAPPF